MSSVINTELAQEVLGFIELNPRRFDVSDYIGGDTENEDFEPASSSACGTVACVAGWAAIFHFDLPLVTGSTTIDCGVRDCQVHPAKVSTIYYYEQPSMGWFDAGQMALGLSEGLARELFLDTSNEQALAALRLLAEGKSEDEVIDFLYDRFEEPCTDHCCASIDGG